MARDHLPPSDHDSEPEEEELVDANVVNPMETVTNSDSEEEAEVEDEEKTESPARGSDADSGQSIPTPSASDFIVKKKSSESEVVKEKSEAKKPKSDKKGKKASEEVVVVAENKAKRSAEKEKSEANKPKSDKKASEEVVVAEDKAKPSVESRFWGPDDDLRILTGMLKYKEETGAHFNTDLDCFYHFMKGELNVVVDKNQLIYRITKLREKYRDNSAKEANGETLVFLKSHEADVYERSKKVWGGLAVPRIKRKSKKEKDIAFKTPAFEVDAPIKSKSKKEKDVASEKEKDTVFEAQVLEVDAQSKSKSKKEKDIVSEKEKDTVFGAQVLEVDSKRKSKSKKEKDIASGKEKDTVFEAQVLEVESQSKSKSRNEKGIAFEMPVLAVENVLALPVPDPKIIKKEVNHSSAKATSRVRKAVKNHKVVQKMGFVETDFKMKDSVFPMPVMVDGVVFQEGLDLVEKSKVDALNEKWTKYQMDAAELYVRRLNLIKQLTELILNALKPSP